MRTLPPILVVLLLGSALLFAACGEEGGAPSVKRVKPPTTVANAPPARRLANGEPERVTVDHILIAVKGPRMPAPRHDDPAEAKAVAYRILDQLRAGGDFQALKKQYSEDPPPGGPYTMANHGVTAQRGRGEFPRGGMAKAFGDVGFALDVGEVGIADHDPATSPFGYHVIKRVR